MPSVVAETSLSERSLFALLEWPPESVGFDGAGVFEEREEERDEMRREMRWEICSEQDILMNVD
jgi:hypothetical protein